METEMLDIYDELYGVIDWLECKHDNLFKHNGDIVCQYCHAVYNEDTLEWEENNG